MDANNELLQAKKHNEAITYLEKKTDNHDVRIYALEQNTKKAL